MRESEALSAVGPCWAARTTAMQDNVQTTTEQHKAPQHTRKRGPQRRTTKQHSTQHSVIRTQRSHIIHSSVEQSAAKTHGTTQRNTHFSSTWWHNAQAHRADGGDPAPPTGVWRHLSASEVGGTWPSWKSVAVARVPVAAICC